MAREQAKIHDTGDFFPVMEFNTTTGETVVLPGDLIGKWGIVLFYRGHGWLYCRQQLLDFEKSIEEFKKNNIEIIAVSTDSMDEARKTAEDNSLSFKIGYGVDAAEVSALTGAFYNKEKGNLHSAGFILAPDGMIASAVYSTGPLGRLAAADCLAFIKYLGEKK